MVVLPVYLLLRWLGAIKIRDLALNACRVAPVLCFAARATSFGPRLAFSSVGHKAARRTCSDYPGSLLHPQTVA